VSLYPGSCAIRRATRVGNPRRKSRRPDPVRVRMRRPACIYSSGLPAGTKNSDASRVAAKPSEKLPGDNCVSNGPFQPRRSFRRSVARRAITRGRPEGRSIPAGHEALHAVQWKNEKARDIPPRVRCPPAGAVPAHWQQTAGTAHRCHAQSTSQVLVVTEPARHRPMLERRLLLAGYGRQRQARCPPLDGETKAAITARHGSRPRTSKC